MEAQKRSNQHALTPEITKLSNDITVINDVHLIKIDSQPYNNSTYNIRVPDNVAYNSIFMVPN